MLNLFLLLDYQAKNKCQNNPGACNYQSDNQIGNIWDGIIGTFVSPSASLAQWIVTILTIVATVVLVLTLRSANKTNVEAVKAANAALEANQIMREEQRPWLDIIATPSGEIRYIPDSNSISIPFDISIKNMGKGPAFNVAISHGLSAVLDEGQDVLGGDAQTALNKNLIEIAQRRSMRNNFTTTIFPGHPHVVKESVSLFRSDKEMITSGKKFGLIFAIVVTYGPNKSPKYISIFPGCIFHDSKHGLFEFTIEEVKSGKGTFRFFDVGEAKLF